MNENESENASVVVNPEIVFKSESPEPLKLKFAVVDEFWAAVIAFPLEIKIPEEIPKVPLPPLKVPNA